MIYYLRVVRVNECNLLINRVWFFLIIMLFYKINCFCFFKVNFCYFLFMFYIEIGIYL